jgi:hypothetical protein
MAIEVVMSKNWLRVQNTVDKRSLDKMAAIYEGKRQKYCSLNIKCASISLLQTAYLFIMAAKRKKGNIEKDDLEEE